MRTPTRRSMLVLRVPLATVDDDVVGGLLAGEHRRQHDAVVVDVRLVAEDRHREARLVLEDLLEAVHPGHAVADDDQASHDRDSVHGALDAHRRLLVVRLPRERVERALRHLVRVGLGVVERHEDLPRRHRLGDPQLDAAHAAAARHHVHLVLRLQAQRPRVARVHLHPGVRRQPLEDRHLAGLGARVPVLDGAAGVEDERELGVRLLGKRLPVRRDQLGLAVVVLERARLVEPPRSAPAPVAPAGNGHWMPP